MQKIALYEYYHFIMLTKVVIINPINYKLRKGFLENYKNIIITLNYNRNNEMNAKLLSV